MTARQLLMLPVVAAAIYFLSSIDQYIFAAYEIPPRNGQIIGFGTALAFIFVALLIGQDLPITRSRAQLAILTLILVYLFYTAVSFLYSRQSTIEFGMMIDRLRGGAFLVIFSIVFSVPKLREFLSVAAVLLLILASALNIYDWVVPTFSQVPGRAAGFYGNPNESGMLLVFLAALACTRKTVLFNYALWALASVGILLTFSRGAWVMMLIAMLGHVYLGYLGGGRGRFVFLLLVAVLFLVTFASYLSGDLYLLAVKSPLADYLDPNTLARLGARGVTLDDQSAIEREFAIQLGIRYFFDSPVVGWGVGATHVWAERASTHNMVVLMAAELGIFGVAFYVAIFALILMSTRGNARLIALLCVVAGNFTHNQLEFVTNVLVLAYCIGSIEVPGTRQRPRHAVQGHDPGQTPPPLAP